MRKIILILSALTATTAMAEPSREACVKHIQATQDCLHSPKCRITRESLEIETQCVKAHSLRAEWRAANDAAELKYDGKVH